MSFFNQLVEEAIKIRDGDRKFVLITVSSTSFCTKAELEAEFQKREIPIASLSELAVGRKNRIDAATPVVIIDQDKMSEEDIFRDKADAKNNYHAANVIDIFVDESGYRII